MEQRTVTVLGEAAGLAGGHQRLRYLATADGRRWVVSAVRPHFAPEGQTVVYRLDEDGEFAYDVVEHDGFDLDGAQAEFEREYRQGTLREPAPLPEPTSGTTASPESIAALRKAVEAAAAGRLHIVPDPDL